MTAANNFITPRLVLKKDVACVTQAIQNDVSVAKCCKTLTVAVIDTSFQSD